MKDNIDKEYLTQIIRIEMQRLGYSDHVKRKAYDEMFDRIYKRICDVKTEPMKLIMPSFEFSEERYVMTDEDKIVMLASVQYDNGMEELAFMKWAVEIK